MNSIQKLDAFFTQKKAHIAYITAGDGGIQRSLKAALALIDGGVNMLEIGVPFSDPIADGPVIQRASTRALNAGITLHDVLKLVEEIRKKSTIPLILFSYLNPILAGKNTNFLAAAKNAGADGLLIVDCPIEEAADFQPAALEHDLAPIWVVTPSTSFHRLQKINANARGFLYYACRKGTTGLRKNLPEDLVEKITAIKSIINLPIVVGFGISARTQVEKVLQHADGAVVGSLFVKAIEDGLQPAELTALAQSIYPTVGVV